jgi:hypothetical protein
MAREVEKQAAPTPSSKVERTGASWFHLFAIALVADIGVFGFLGKAEEMGIGGGLLILGLIFTRLHVFKSFKGFGLEAELQEKLDRAEKVSSEAYATARQVQELAKALGTNALITLARTGVMASISLTERVFVANQVQTALRSIWRPRDRGCRHLCLAPASRMRQARPKDQEAG